MRGRVQAVPAWTILVVKTQAVDIVEVVSQLLRRSDVVQTSCRNRKSQTPPDLVVKFQPLEIVGVIPTASLDVISLVASSCGYYRGHIEHRVAH
jgi:hypothetical protein